MERSGATKQYHGDAVVATNAATKHAEALESLCARRFAWIPWKRPPACGHAALARHVTILIALLIALLPATAAAGEARPQPLGAYGAASEQVTVSGLSSGAYMAAQLAVAYSSIYSGVGVIAGGPYGCAYSAVGLSGNINRALGPCMAGGYSAMQRWQCFFFIASCPGPDAPDATRSIELVRENAKRGAIDPLAHLARQRVFLLSGKQDRTLVPAVVSALERFYAAFVPAANIRHESLPHAAHTFPTDTYAKGNACAVGKPPYVSDCDYDAAGRLLEHLKGPLKPRNDAAPAGALIAFEQKPFFPAGIETGMGTTGYVYVPKVCTEKEARCRIHVALHGCRQTVSEIGLSFVEGAGYNRWADTNALIVLYPQVRTATSRFDANPENCWDWWGYTGSVWLERNAPQMRAIGAMVRHVQARPR
jgi:pimeloyl-ACP methyl ester carboxylesterase